ncbi:MAG: bifunctional diaminohydroxyphosphoribosylaminopyrimidine deaminase/5-amino-6-(5-phosphoribosylamino)uracil reductase RibD [Deltaproteobacteria bacterium]|jgi:diaminohydroxyphosphoribosylaminopyrimidine deaminase/5-amino-6-(5-phosphoribosylamino)uracil reductase|nr:bifunctional diaminohydroxyphosphoribosylaminopyrimidine deaminase/5-amino-6-(5-phosphoribosylamino)uracil reductase RibD [Deltaproteobacteria bacterium]
MWSDFERDVMAQAIAEARRGRPSPNPRVGAAIVRGQRVVALGYHAKAGLAHAEVDAIREAGSGAEGATLYVTLEPCNHQGRTGPCTEAILEAGVARVVIGCRDPAPHVPGAIARLEAGGIDVEVGLLEPECTTLIADFAKHIKTGRPFVTLKAAITLDGKIATRTGDSKWITGEAARTEAHRLRDDSDAVLVGVGTVLADDPALTVRHVTGRNPIRVVLDADLRTPENATILERAGTRDTEVLIFHAENAAEARREKLRRPGIELIPVSRDARGVDLCEVLDVLGKRDVVRLLVEGGARVHGTFLDLGLADRAAIFIAPRVLGDAEAISFAAGEGADSIAQAWSLVRTEMRTLGTDWLVTGDLERKQ